MKRCRVYLKMQPLCSIRFNFFCLIWVLPFCSRFPHKEPQCPLCIPNSNKYYLFQWHGLSSKAKLLTLLRDEWTHNIAALVICFTSDSIHTTLKKLVMVSPGVAYNIQLCDYNIHMHCRTRGMKRKIGILHTNMKINSVSLFHI